MIWSTVGWTARNMHFVATLIRTAGSAARLGLRLFRTVHIGQGLATRWTMWTASWSGHGKAGGDWPLCPWSLCDEQWMFVAALVETAWDLHTAMDVFMCSARKSAMSWSCYGSILSTGDRTMCLMWSSVCFKAL